MEIYKEIFGFKNYEVSNYGNVKRKEGTSHLICKPLKHLIDKDGYKRVNLKVHQKTNTKNIHRLVAIAFIPNLENKPQVNHINGIKGDNRIENLEWCTMSENRQHAYNTGLQNGLTRRGVLNNFNKLSENEVIKIRFKYDKKTCNMKKLSLEYKVSAACIQMIISKKTWSWI